MAMANMNLIGVFVTKLWPVQALACGGGDGGGGGGATKNIISPKIFKFRGYNNMVTHYFGTNILMVFGFNVLFDTYQTSECCGKINYIRLFLLPSGYGRVIQMSIHLSIIVSINNQNNQKASCVLKLGLCVWGGGGG